MLTRLIPKVFYAQMDDALALFVGCLGFTVLHHTGVCVIFRGWS